jgi:hypothetical protein
MQAITSKEEPVKHEVKQCKPWTARKKPTMLSNDEPVRDAKQYKQCPVRMNQWGLNWNNVNHAQ